MELSLLAFFTYSQRHCQTFLCGLDLGQFEKQIFMILVRFLSVFALT